MVDNPHYNYVIPDVRFPNEMSMIRELGGQVWQVRRGELPLWWATAQSVNQNWDTCKDTNHSMATVFPDVHQSEWRWVDNDNQFEHILTNNDTLEALYSQVEQTLST